MSYAASSFQVPSRIVSNPGLPSFVSCSNSLIGHEIFDGSSRLAVARARQPFLRTSTGEVKVASKFSVNHTTGHRAPSGWQVSTLVNKAYPSPLLPCDVARQTPVPTASEKSILPCDSIFYSATIPNDSSEPVRRMIANIESIRGARPDPSNLNIGLGKVFTDINSTSLSYLANSHAGASKWQAPHCPCVKAECIVNLDCDNPNPISSRILVNQMYGAFNDMTVPSYGTTARNLQFGLKTAQDVSELGIMGNEIADYIKENYWDATLAGEFDPALEALTQDELRLVFPYVWGGPSEPNKLYTVSNLETAFANVRFQPYQKLIQRRTVEQWQNNLIELQEYAIDFIYGATAADGRAVGRFDYVKQADLDLHYSLYNHAYDDLTEDRQRVIRELSQGVAEGVAGPPKNPYPYTSLCAGCLYLLRSDRRYNEVSKARVFNTFALPIYVADKGYWTEKYSGTVSILSIFLRHVDDWGPDAGLTNPEIATVKEAERKIRKGLEGRLFISLADNSKVQTAAQPCCMGTWNPGTCGQTNWEGGKVITGLPTGSGGIYGINALLLYLLGGRDLMRLLPRSCLPMTPAEVKQACPDWYCADGKYCCSCD